jgi:hypothetical protein
MSSALTSGRQNFIKNFHLFAGERGSIQREDPAGKTIFNEIVTKTLNTAKNVKVAANVTLPWENDQGLLYNSEGEKLLFRINYLRYNLSLVPYEKGHAPETEKEREEEDVFFTEWGFKKPMENPFATRTADPYYTPTAEASQAMWNELIKCELAYAEMQAEVDYRKALVHWILGEAPDWQYSVCDWIHNKEGPSQEDKEKMKHSHISLTRGIVQAEEVENGMKAFFMKYLLGKMPENDEEAHLYYKYGVLGKPVYFKYILDEFPTKPTSTPSSAATRVPGIAARASAFMDRLGLAPDLGPLKVEPSDGPEEGGTPAIFGGSTAEPSEEDIPLEEPEEDIPDVADAAVVESKSGPNIWQKATKFADALGLAPELGAPEVNAEGNGWFSWIKGSSSPVAAATRASPVKVEPRRAVTVKSETTNRALPAASIPAVAPVTSSPATVIKDEEDDYYDAESDHDEYVDAEDDLVPAPTTPAVIRAETIAQSQPRMFPNPALQNTSPMNTFTFNGETFPTQEAAAAAARAAQNSTSSSSLFPHLAALKTEVESKAEPTSPSLPTPASSASSSPTTVPEGVGVGELQQPRLERALSRKPGSRGRENFDVERPTPHPSWQADEIATWGIKRGLLDEHSIDAFFTRMQSTNKATGVVELIEAMDERRKWGN